MAIIGLCGRRHSGKTTAAQHLISEHNYVKVEMPEPIKTMLRSLGLGDAELNGPLKEKPCSYLGGATPREAMETLGELWGRQMIHPELWTHYCKGSARERIDAYATRGHNILLDGIRNPSEANLVLSRGGIIVRIVRPETDTQDVYPSERLIDTCQYTFKVVNDTYINSFIAEIDSIHEREMSRDCLETSGL